YQMIQLADEVRARGGEPCEALEYKRRYHELLTERIRGRITSLESGTATAVEWTVPGSHAFLNGLMRRGVRSYLASGTDQPYVRREAELLGLKRFFGDRIYGARDDY